MNESEILADWFSKPGDSIRRLMHKRGVSVESLASNFSDGVSDVRGLLDGSLAIESESAATLAATVGGTKKFWLKRQDKYEQALDRAVSCAVSFEFEDWLDKVPDPKPARKGKSDEATTREAIRRRLKYFNVPTISSWQARYGHLLSETRFRKTDAYETVDSSILLWLRQGELEAEMVVTQPWDATKLEERLGSITKLSQISKPSRFLPKLRALCAEAGVAVVVVKTPRGCPASGATRRIASDKAMLLLSFRYLSDDQFWFTVFHEIGHLLLHGDNTYVDGEQTEEDECEREANDYAHKCIIPEDRLDEFASLPGNRKAVLRFSTSLGVSTGLVVGQMQYFKKIEPSKLNGLKRHWKWVEINSAFE